MCLLLFGYKGTKKVVRGKINCTGIEVIPGGDYMQDNFAEKISAMRKAKGWSQEVLAEKCGISRQAVAKWESSQSMPDVFRLIDLAKLFGVELSELVKTTGNVVDMKCCIEALKKMYPLIIGANLTDNSYQFIKGREYFLNIEESGDIGMLVREVIDSVPEASQRAEIAEKLGRNNLIEAMLDGEESVSIRYRAVVRDRLIWVETNVCFIHGLGHDDIVVLSRSIEDEVRLQAENRAALVERQYIIDILTSEYDSAHYINVSRDELHLLKFNEERISSYIGGLDISSGVLCYTQVLPFIVNSVVAEPERRHVKEMFSLENLKNVLSRRKSFSDFFNIVIFGQIHKYEIRMVRIDDTDDFCIAVGFINRDEDNQVCLAENTEDVITSKPWLNTGLAAILGYIQLAQTADTPEKRAEYLNSAYNHGSKLMDVISDNRKE